MINQEEMLAMLKKLGGRATHRQLMEAIGPQPAFYDEVYILQVINKRLNKLRKWGEVTTVKGTFPIEWIIKNK